MNQFMCIGNLCRDVEVTTTNSGKTIAKFSIAVSRDFDREKTDFFNVQVWGALGENCAKYLSKGKKVCVVGRIEFENFEDKNGNKKQSTTVTADKVEFLSPSGNNTPSEIKIEVPKKIIKDQLLNDEDGEQLPF